MRQSLLPGMIRAVSYNISRQIQDIRIFELANVYFLKESRFNEEPFLGLMEYGKSAKGGKGGHLSSGIFQIKGAIAALGKRLGVVKLVFEKIDHPLFAHEESLAVLSGDTILGAMGRIRPELLKDFDIKSDLFAAELNFKTITASSTLDRSYTPLPRFPFSYRDISFAVDDGMSYKDISGLIRKTGGALIERIELLSEYRGEHIPENQRGLAFRIICRAKDRTLTEDEINKLDNDIRGNLARTFKVTLR
jgi:phenylalanyl-tRNA synthetase beta chain